MSLFVVFIIGLLLGQYFGAVAFVAAAPVLVGLAAAKAMYSAQEWR